KRIEGPVEAEIRAHRDVDGVRYYMSQWSWERQQRGIEGNWMRTTIPPIGEDANPPAPPTPPREMPPPPATSDFDVTEYESKVLFPDGYELVNLPSEDSPIIERVDEPTLLQIGGSTTVGPFQYYLTPSNNAARKTGRDYQWVRFRTYPVDPDLARKFAAIVPNYDLYRDAEFYSRHPWRLSRDLFESDRTESLRLTQSIPIEPHLLEIARHSEDQEFPADWLASVAEHLKKRGTLPQAIDTLSRNLPVRERTVELYLQSEEAEMGPGIERAAILFDTRFIALLEAARGNWAGVEVRLAPIVAEWNPEEDGLNASGPRINMTRLLARAQWEQGKVEEATRNTRIWLDAFARNLASDLLHPDYVDAEQRVMEFDDDFEKIGSYFDILGSITDPDVAAEVVTGLKGLQLAVTTSRQSWLETSSDPQQARLLNEWKELDEAARQTILSGKEFDSTTAQRLSELHASLSLARLTGGDLALREDPAWTRAAAEVSRLEQAGADYWELTPAKEARDLAALDFMIKAGDFIMSPLSIREAIPENTALIDYFRSESGEISHYGAIIHRRSSSPELVTLGAADEIDVSVSDFRDFIQGLGDYIDKDLETLEGALPEKLSDLYSRLITPLEEAIGGDESLLICPDGELFFLPFEFLAPRGGESVEDRWAISYLNAARDLIRERRTLPYTAPVILLGNPSFETDDQSENDNARGLAFDDTTRSALAEATRGLSFGPLPGTQDEIDLLQPLLIDAGLPVTQLEKTEAVEGAITSLSEPPKILHLATHGFFLPELPILDRSALNSATDPGMLTSGLALTGAQNTLEAWGEGSVPAPSSDGILLAAEVAQLNLQGTDLVVLSACETAVGRTLTGEGVEGLRTALTIAGAENVLLTLWPVDDIATVAVMEKFYEQLLLDLPAGQALQKAREELFESFRTEFGVYQTIRILAPFVVSESGQ
ncbi:MAG: CHAT domain-containing protein, partial [Verrucomicrobiota bacterium]